jgi:dTDP-glucose 4,6-dehydratase
LKVLVTGGAGFIGSNFIRHYLHAHPQENVVNLDKLTYAGNLANLSDVENLPNYKLVRGDICDLETVDAVFSSGVDAVVHFAAESHVDRSIMDAREFVATNIQGTFSLLDAARRHKIPRFLLVSTDEVYGSMQPGESAGETTPLDASSPYAASKAAADLLALSFWKTHRFPVVLTRCSNNYGPFQFPEKLIPLMITNALEGKKLPVYGDGLNERDWIFVEDHCAALERVLESGEPGEIYNIGFGRPATNLQIIRRLLEILGASEDLIEFVPDRPGHDRRYALDTQKIRRKLNWEASVSLEAGLSRTVEWYETHSEWVNLTKSGEYRSYYQKLYANRGATLAEL